MQLSIITINYNNASELKRTIESVVSQTWKEFEFIVIDGGSFDESVNVIRQNECVIDYWVSEPDKGIYNAMNKGIEVSKGEYLLMLNSGDRLYKPNTLFDIFNNKFYEESILYGNAILESKGKIFGEKVFDQPITFDFFRRASLSHQACFIKKDLHTSIGLYDENMKFSSDWKFFILATCKYNVTTKYLNFFIAECNCDGLTWSPSNFPMMKEEIDTVLHEYFPNFIPDYQKFDLIRDRKNFIKTSGLAILNKARKIYRIIIRKKN